MTQHVAPSTTMYRAGVYVLLTAAVLPAYGGSVSKWLVMTGALLALLGVLGGSFRRLRADRVDTEVESA